MVATLLDFDTGELYGGSAVRAEGGGEVIQNRLRCGSLTPSVPPIETEMVPARTGR